MAAFVTRGHQRALRFVERAVHEERPPHALLLEGPTGAGKTTLAFDLAAGLLCLAEDPRSRPCRDCAACRKLAHANHPDVHRLVPEGAGQQIRVGQVHQLAAELALLPLEGRYRLAIVEHAQRLNQDAQNALLKTLEEPPARAVLVLAADDSAALLPTVISRCARLRLGPLPAPVVADLLVELDAADGARAATIARLAGGRPGRALELAGQPELIVSHGQLARTLLNLLTAGRRQRLAAVSELLELGTALATAPASDQADDWNARKGSGSNRQAPAARRAATAQVISVWRDVARDLALAGRGARSELRLADLLDELTAVAGQSGRSAAAFVTRLDDVQRAIDAYANPDLALDVLLLEWPAAAA
jgi:DNA polymerase III subunit delta'